MCVMLCMACCALVCPGAARYVSPMPATPTQAHAPPAHGLPAGSVALLAWLVRARLTSAIPPPSPSCLACCPHDDASPQIYRHNIWSPNALDMYFCASRAFYPTPPNHFSPHRISDSDASLILILALLAWYGPGTAWYSLVLLLPAASLVSHPPLAPCTHTRSTSTCFSSPSTALPWLRFVSRGD